MSFLASREDLVFFAFCQEDAILEHFLDNHWLSSPLQPARLLDPFQPPACSPCLCQLPRHAPFAALPRMVFYPLRDGAVPPGTALCESAGSVSRADISWASPDDYLRFLWWLLPFKVETPGLCVFLKLQLLKSLKDVFRYF